MSLVSASPRTLRPSPCLLLVIALLLPVSFSVSLVVSLALLSPSLSPSLSLSMFLFLTPSFQVLTVLLDNFLAYSKMEKDAAAVSGAAAAAAEGPAGEARPPEPGDDLVDDSEGGLGPLLDRLVACRSKAPRSSPPAGAAALARLRSQPATDPGRRRGWRIRGRARAFRHADTGGRADVLAALETLVQKRTASTSIAPWVRTLTVAAGAPAALVRNRGRMCSDSDPQPDPLRRRIRVGGRGRRRRRRTEMRGDRAGSRPVLGARLAREAWSPPSASPSESLCPILTLLSPILTLPPPDQSARQSASRAPRPAPLPAPSHSAAVIELGPLPPSHDR